MEIPDELRYGLEILAAKTDTRRLTEAAKAISERYRAENGHSKRITSDIEAAAYALARMPATYGAISMALGYALEHFDGTVETLLDAGAGTGAAMWAASSQFECKSITCVEREDVMLRLGKRLAEAGPDVVRKARWVNADIINCPLPAADLIIAAYVLNELNEINRVAVLHKLWAVTGKILLIVEPGTPVHSEMMARIRREMNKLGYFIAPCPHDGECGEWCHFTARTARSRIHKRLKDGEAPYEDEKFTYMAFSKEKVPRPSGRVLRHPAIGSGRVKLNICRADGTIADIIVTKKDGDSYKLARKLKTGDSFEY